MFATYYFLSPLGPFVSVGLYAPHPCSLDRLPWDLAM